MTLPNFFVVGTQKGGTTSLHHYLCGHPGVYLPAQKETKFFARPDRYALGIQHYEQTFFNAAEGKTAVGEIDPDYMYYEEAVDRMAAHFDMRELRFIFLLRNPVKRAYSHYLMTVRRGQEELSFDQAIQQEEERLRGDYFARNRYSYVSRGFYMPQIRRFADRAGRENLLFLLSEQLQEDPQAVARACFEFLRVDPQHSVPNAEKRFHGAATPRSPGLLRWMKQDSGTKQLLRGMLPFKRLRSNLRKTVLAWNESDRRIPPMSDAARHHLTELYRPGWDELASFTGLDIGRWRKEAS